MGLQVEHDGTALAALLVAAPLRALQGTLDELALAREAGDRVDAHLLAGIVLRDPALCLHVLCEAGRLAARLATPLETVTASLLVTGIDRFFGGLDGMSSIEARLGGNPPALRGAMGLVERAWCAARIAAAFAIHRQDEDAELLHQAALIADVAELIAWCEVPGPMLEVARRQRDDTQLRTERAHRDVLGSSLAALQPPMLQRRGAPEAVRALLEPANRSHPGAHCVLLASRLARHLQGGWNNAALGDDFAEAGLLLNLPAGGAMNLVRQATG